MRKKEGQRNYYFSDKLKNQLARIPFYPLTIVEAPSGFGKTTAVREYLRENLPANAAEYWYTCLGEPAATAWRSISELFGHISETAAANMNELGMPTLDTLSYLITELRKITCGSETYLVIDNFHLVDCEAPRELLSIFSMHNCPRLHLIFITQQLGPRQQLGLHNADIHTIDSSAFFFDREGIAALFRMEGMRLSPEEVDKVFISTEGWASAIRLQIINYQENGTFNNNADIEHLVETAIWNRLSPEEKEFLQAVSIAESFTARQAAALIGQEVLPDKIEELLKVNDFIRYYPDQGVYIMHSILASYLQNRFYHHQSEAFQKQVLRRAGASLAAMGQYYPAAQHYFKTKDYDAILALPFDCEYMLNQKEKDLVEFVIALLEACPDECLSRYPYRALSFGSLMFISGQPQQYRRVCRLLEELLASTEVSPEDSRRIKGELLIIQSLEHFNDIIMMEKYHRKAWELLKQPSRLLKSKTPFTFGVPSILFMYWRESGQMENAVKAMDDSLPSYRRLAQGHGSGANSVMRAEAMLARGEDEEAEILCHKALYEARSYGQISVCLCAEMVLARIYILRGDTEGYLMTIKNIKEYPEKDPNLYVLRMVDQILTVIGLTLGIKEMISEWCENLDSIKKTVYLPAMPYAHMLYSMILVAQKRYQELYGLSELIIDAAKNITDNIRFMAPQIYQLKYLALAKVRTGNNREALEYLKRALELALPDKSYLVFANQGLDLVPLLEEAKRALADKEGVSAVIALCKRNARGVQAIQKALQTAKSPLTPREREIALLSRNRWSAKEIAEKLYIAETTVRTILRSIYSKLNIHSRSDLNKVEF